MSSSLGGRCPALGHGAKDDFVRVRRRDVERLTTEVMQLRDFLPRVLTGDLVEKLHKARTAQTAHVLLNTLMKLLEQMKSGVFPKLKVYVELW
ncbi:hypothetical protein F2P81_002189 [Scophthalmus maximus]|uniref:Uncharacterized protein n=1 Tax=Scophthalmus maximus TaxID=52904 RepID=A0A6A4TQ15_SCOMX|nr:hypothetical protein F2P81_002189 [Scophthalmus maximus]